MLGTCCSLRGKVAARELDALGETDLSNRMYDNMTASEALFFAVELRAAADALEARHADASDKPKGAGWDGVLDRERLIWVYESYTPFDEAVASIREAARWYEKVGKLGYGVHAWS